MWWLLLVFTVEGYRAEIIVQTESQCAAIKHTEQDLCIPVQVSFPEMGPAT